MSKSKYVDYPFADITKRAKELAWEGYFVYQKYTCEACGTRLTIPEPNSFHRTGACDKCPHITDIEKNGCNYMVSTRPLSTGEDNAGTPFKN